MTIQNSLLNCRAQTIFIDGLISVYLRNLSQFDSSGLAYSRTSDFA